MTALPGNVWFWLLVVVVFGAVVLYALSRTKGRSSIELPGGFGAKVDNEPDRAGQDRAVRVADRIEVERGGSVGKVTGVRGPAAAAVDRPVDVANEARVRGRVGDITGVDAGKE